MSRVPFRECRHRVHDYRFLVQRWKRIARAAGLKLVEFARAGECPIYVLETPGAADEPNGLYLSAGIHGDEPAGPEALASWAERHLSRIARRKRRPLPLVILPCLNPWGLINNQRVDEHAHDLNRIFDRRSVPPIDELRQLLRGRRFDLAVTMHEDYDAQGVYLYELARQSSDLAEHLLEAASRVIPIDTRTRIDGRPARNGIMRRRANLQRIPLHPEAVYLYLHHCDRVLTVETPSEFGIARRIDAHVKMLEVCVERVLQTRPRGR